MSSVHQFISQIRDQQTSARYEVKANGRVIANLVATTTGSSLLTGAGDCVIKEAFDLLPGSNVLSIGKMAAGERNRSGKDHNVCIFAPSVEGQKGEIKTLGYGQPTPDQQYTEQVTAFEQGAASAVVLFAGHWTKNSPLGTEFQVQYTTVYYVNGEAVSYEAYLDAKAAIELKAAKERTVNFKPVLEVQCLIQLHAW